MNLLIDTLVKPHILYVRLRHNRIEVKHLQTARWIDRTAERAFSNERLLIADPLVAQDFMRTILTELFGTMLLKRSLHFLLQPVDEMIKEISPAENMIYYEFAHQSGAKAVSVYPTQEMLDDDQVIRLLKSRD